MSSPALGAGRTPEEAARVLIGCAMTRERARKVYGAARLAASDALAALLFADAEYVEARAVLMRVVESLTVLAPSGIVGDG